MAHQHLRMGGRGKITDTEILEAMFEEKLSHAKADTRRESDKRGIGSISEALSAPLLPSSINTAEIDIAPTPLWRAQRRATLRLVEGIQDGPALGSDPVIAIAMAKLLGKKLNGKLADPFCGTGGFLWSAIEIGMERGAHLEEAIGVDLAVHAANLARTLAKGSPIPTKIIGEDGFKAPVSGVDCIVSAPPYKVDLNDPYELLDGTTTHAGDIAAIDRCIRMLKPEGRAALHLTRSFTSDSSARNYRQYLATNLRISALIGLPSGSLYGSSVRSVILVVDKSAPSETFICQLGDDWKEQLSPTGSALNAACEHIDGNESC